MQHQHALFVRGILTIMPSGRKTFPFGSQVVRLVISKLIKWSLFLVVCHQLRQATLTSLLCRTLVTLGFSLCFMSFGTIFTPDLERGIPLRGIEKGGRGSQDKLKATLRAPNCIFESFDGNLLSRIRARQAHMLRGLS